MCNAFNTASKKVFKEGLLEESFPTLIRRTDLAPVVLLSGEVVEMRWGFERSNLSAVNNARCDNLSSKMWKEAFAKRRCLIPLMSYYEWRGSKKNRRTYLFQSPKKQWIFAAGIWERSSEFGLCFSMLTTDANKVVAPIHHRMPVILDQAERPAYLNNELQTFAPDPRLLVVKETPSPFLKNRPTHIQDELF